MPPSTLALHCCCHSSGYPYGDFPTNQDQPKDKIHLFVDSTGATILWADFKVGDDLIGRVHASAYFDWRP